MQQQEGSAKPKREEVLETNLLPAAVPTEVDLPPVVITEQPGLIRNNSTVDGITGGQNLPTVAYGLIKEFILEIWNYLCFIVADPRRESHHFNRRNHLVSANPTGLANLSVADSLLIEIKKGCFGCDTNYVVCDATEGSEGTLIFSAVEELACCNLGSLRNVVFRDKDSLPLARACFKEKHFLLSSLVVAVYAPPELLVGSVEETASCCMLSSEFILRNSDGDNLLRLNPIQGWCNSSFTVTTFVTNEEIATVMIISRRQIRMNFISKINITQKLSLVGFSIGLINKNNVLSCGGS